MALFKKIKNYFAETFKDLSRDDAKGALRHSLNDIQKNPWREIPTLLIIAVLPGPWLLAYAIHRLHHYRMHKENPDHKTTAFLNAERVRDAGKLARHKAKKAFNAVSTPVKKSVAKVKRAVRPKKPQRQKPQKA
jgi:hypothetical protein